MSIQKGGKDGVNSEKREGPMGKGPVHVSNLNESLEGGINSNKTGYNSSKPGDNRGNTPTMQAHIVNNNAKLNDTNIVDDNLKPLDVSDGKQGAETLTIEKKDTIADQAQKAVNNSTVKALDVNGGKQGAVTLTIEKKDNIADQAQKAVSETTIKHQESVKDVK